MSSSKIDRRVSTKQNGRKAVTEISLSEGIMFPVSCFQKARRTPTKNWLRIVQSQRWGYRDTFRALDFPQKQIQHSYNYGKAQLPL